MKFIKFLLLIVLLCLSFFAGTKYENLNKAKKQPKKDYIEKVKKVEDNAARNNLNQEKLNDNSMNMEDLDVINSNEETLNNVIEKNVDEDTLDGIQMPPMVGEEELQNSENSETIYPNGNTSHETGSMTNQPNSTDTEKHPAETQKNGNNTTNVKNTGSTGTKQKK